MAQQRPMVSRDAAELPLMLNVRVGTQNSATHGMTQEPEWRSIFPFVPCLAILQHAQTLKFQI